MKHDQLHTYDERGFVSASDGTRIFYGVKKSSRPEGGLPFVLLDGIGCDGFAWKYLHPHVSQTRRVVHFHYRGHGRSGLPQDPARIDIAAHARDLLEVMDATGTDKAILCGHSMGTQVALEAYRLAPERVGGLVLLCGSYGRITTTFRGSDMLKQVLPTIIEAVESNRGLVRALWGRMPSRLAFQIARLSGEVDRMAIREEDFLWYVDHVASMEPRLFLAMLRLAGEHSAEDVLARIEVPALVIAAERDTFTPPVLARHMAEEIPGAELLVLTGASHAAPIEQPRVIESALDRWLEASFADAKPAAAATSQASTPSARPRETQAG